MQEMRLIRGNRIAMIFQEPMTSLNPVFTIGNQISEMFILHRKASRKGGPGGLHRDAGTGTDSRSRAAY
jgi:ABC-type microcin C transport system duplicated ATPase subunit YejF